MTETEQVATARRLFEAWSSGDPDAPHQYLADDAVLYDIVAGDAKEGWPAIRTFFAEGLKVWPDLRFDLGEFWTNGNGVALTWVMSATVADDRFGGEARGKRWRSEGMTALEFRGGKVVREVDYHNGASVPRSLGVAPAQ